MRRWLVVLMAFGLTASGWVASAAARTIVNGIGTGTFGADGDGDGDTDGSHFGLGAIVEEGGRAQGHFLCGMAGNTDFLGLPIMSVEGRITSGFLNGDGSCTVRGVSSVILGDGQIFRDLPYSATLTAGGPGVGTLRLTVFGAFDGVPGDTAPGNGNYDLPLETVKTGQISIR